VQRRRATRYRRTTELRLLDRGGRDDPVEGAVTALERVEEDTDLAR